MRIAVLGATGQTGQYLVKQAIQKGYGVTAVVRNPGKLLVRHENLKVRKYLSDCYLLGWCSHVTVPT